MSGPVAFVFAMPMELTPLAKRMSLRRERVGGSEVRAGRLGERDVVAVVTGMGTELATRGTRCMLDAISPERVLVVGITGAVDDETPIGTLVLPEVVVNGETGDEFRPAPLGVMWTTNRLTPAHELPALRARGVVALDMETAAVARCCEERGIPWSVFRVISDRATDGSVGEEVFALSNQDGTPNLPRVMRYLLRHPHHVPRLARLARGSSVATRGAVDAALDALASAGPPGPSGS